MHTSTSNSLHSTPLSLLIKITYSYDAFLQVQLSLKCPWFARCELQRFRATGTCKKAKVPYNHRQFRTTTPQNLLNLAFLPGFLQTKEKTAKTRTKFGTSALPQANALYKRDTLEQFFCAPFIPRLGFPTLGKMAQKERKKWRVGLVFRICFGFSCHFQGAIFKAF